jgi:predicted CoA-substrate-specific enzyme activase
MKRYVGADVGAETIKLVELVEDQDGSLQCTRHELCEHYKQPGKALLAALSEWRWDQVDSAAASGRLARVTSLPRVPIKQAQVAGYRFKHQDRPATIVSIGSHGFSVLELRASGVELLRESPRCSQGTGSFLRQLVERFNLTIEEASRLCVDVADPAPLSGRCPVILKTDMTHLANQGESRARVIAGLYDAVCDNVQVLVNPRSAPSDLVLIGGVAQAQRIRDSFSRFAERNGMILLEEDDSRFIEALGCAVLAAEKPAPAPALDRLLSRSEPSCLEKLPPLSSYLQQVQHMPQPDPVPESSGGLILGFDIGSTGSKLVALDVERQAVVWQSYVSTSGNPVAAAHELMQRFVNGPAAAQPLLACGATGSGREIVGSLLATCYGSDSVFILNEIAAHATGALYYDHRVDTIFEIGGQDAKYIRLSHGRVVDAAMNEACSAGTGSFIEEQGRRLAGVDGIVQLGDQALAAGHGVSLGQHCSVFMAEVIDEAVAGGAEQREIIAGLYDSVIQNYLNRVKGNRSVGSVVFCQGMPFSAGALAAAVARQTGSEVIVPPSPGMVGALGISLLASREIDLSSCDPLAPQRFLGSRVTGKDIFVCSSTRGCGGAGNHCRINRLTTNVEGRKQQFTWGGSCSLYDRGTRQDKLPDRAPNPFKERAMLLADLGEQLSESRGRPQVAMTDEFQLAELFPLFATFVHELGFDLKIHSAGGRQELKRGIEEANVPLCAPMQLYQGLAAAMAESDADYLFLPMVRTLPRVNGEQNSILCPIGQASPELIRCNLAAGKVGIEPGRIVAPLIDIGRDNLASSELARSCRLLAAELGAESRWQAALGKARLAQERFDRRCLDIGRQALQLCAEQGLAPIVVLGRAYTIHNDILNSNVPSILRSQGAMAIPVDCYPVSSEIPAFASIYWAFGQRSLRAAHQVRRSHGHYSLWCSNYSCGPDSFAVHFYSYIMEGKPYAVIETDGHAGDAGTRTRVEAFLYCVREDLQRPPGSRRSANHFQRASEGRVNLSDIRTRGERLLIPRLGWSGVSLAASLRSMGVEAECLPLADREALRTGRRYTSGKECLPMCITLGSLLERLDGEQCSSGRFAFLMPTTCGPCRFGVYHLLHKIVLDRLAWGDRVGIWSPVDNDYFRGVPVGGEVLIFTGAVIIDMLLQAFLDVCPVESSPGAAQQVFDTYISEILGNLERPRSASELSLAQTLLEVTSGRLFGCTPLLRRAVAELAAVKTSAQVPTVLVVGEIYVRLDPFANDFIVDKLARHGIRPRLAPMTEWFDYADWAAADSGKQRGWRSRLRAAIKRRITDHAYAIAAAILGWEKRHRIAEVVAAAEPYVRSSLHGEAALTVGSPRLAWRHRSIDGVLSVGPLECMPNKISEAQLLHIAESEGLPSLTLALNGDPIDPEILESFVYEIHSRFQTRRHV